MPESIDAVLGSHGGATTLYLICHIVMCSAISVPVHSVWSFSMASSITSILGSPYMPAQDLELVQEMFWSISCIAAPLFGLYVSVSAA